MEIAAVAGLTVVYLPDGRRAVVLVEIMGPQTAVTIAGQLAGGLPSGSDKEAAATWPQA